MKHRLIFVLAVGAIALLSVWACSAIATPHVGPLSANQIPAIEQPGPAPEVSALAMPTAPSSTWEAPSFSRLHVPLILVCALGVGFLLWGLADQVSISGTNLTITGEQVQGVVTGLKSGYKTTEFWIALLTILGGIATTLFGADSSGGGQETATTVGGLATAVGGLAYNVSRGLAKLRN